MNETSQQHKVPKFITRTGGLVVGIGWLNVLIAIALAFLLTANYLLRHVPVTLLTVFVVIDAAVVFIILGKRIMAGVDKNIKIYIDILLALSALDIIYTLYTGALAGGLFFVMFVFLIIAHFKMRKLMKSHEFTATLTSPTYMISKQGWVVFVAISVLLFIGLYTFDVRVQRAASPSIKSEQIAESVKAIKSATHFPQKIDSSTEMTDIVAESNAIHFYYRFTGVDTAKISNESIKSTFLPGLCANSDVLVILNSDVTLKYSYAAASSTKTYFVEYTKADCAK